MSLIILDASAVAGWSLPGQTSAAAEDLLRQARQHRFLAPHIFPIEVRNFFLAAERGQRWRATWTEAALDGLDALEIDVVRMDEAEQLRAVMQTARATGLSLYDAFYLALAEEEGAMVASRDKPLLEAARRRGVAVINLNV